ncbi:hypothetical protein DRE_01017 [Drechslerella stenobrocha 248]|uniref:ABC transporter domain-containing protein n=1 Tax=Drechslerella stenobrocha 248 TaxID=1043628 RepID=W7HYF2_9PEZI|nr:hypothetical protein DRE_01017 [Drechslerella stenobrocha 248]
MSSPLIRIVNSTFHRHAPSSPSFFPNLSFRLPLLANTAKPERWSVIGPSDSGKSTFLQILQGSHACSPPGGRTFPALAEQRRYPTSAIGMVDFSTRGAFGESVWLERTALDLPLYTDNYDFATPTATHAADVPLETVTAGLRLTQLLEQPVSTLSNGQGRRARIAQALLRGVDLLLLDEPFMGLDPYSVEQLSQLLRKISSPGAAADGGVSAQVVVSQRPQDHLPDWVTHIVYLHEKKVLAMGDRESVVDRVSKDGVQISDQGGSQNGILQKVYGSATTDVTPGAGATSGGSDTVVEMEGINIAYRNREILKDFSWKIRRGERWGLFGPNGSGKTTLLAIITSDHPLSYSQPVKLFGRSRLPTRGVPGISVFELQSLIGHSSPEIHQFFPRRLTLRQCVESAWADTFISKPHFPPTAQGAIDAIFTTFGVSAAEQAREFGDCGVSMQRLALFMRAVVKKPDIVILDEAFSGMDGELRDRCMRYLEEGLEERQALVVVSHLQEEIPRVVDRWVRLREAGDLEGAVFGRNE